MAIFVFPAPLCAALTTRETTVKIMNPIMILKYCTASAWEASSEPHSRMIGSAKATQIRLTATDITRTNTLAAHKTSLAPLRFFCPLRLATSADTDTFTAINMASPINFGWVVNPTAATACAPTRLTIKESTIPTSATKNDSSTDGHAIFSTVCIFSLLYFFIFSPHYLRSGEECSHAYNHSSYEYLCITTPETPVLFIVRYNDCPVHKRCDKFVVAFSAKSRLTNLSLWIMIGNGKYLATVWMRAQ